jgi:hypothetical protein
VISCPKLHPGRFQWGLVYVVHVVVVSFDFFFSFYFWLRNLISIKASQRKLF